MAILSQPLLISASPQDNAYSLPWKHTFRLSSSEKPAVFSMFGYFDEASASRPSSTGEVSSVLTTSGCVTCYCSSAGFSQPTKPNDSVPAAATAAARLHQEKPYSNPASLFISLLLIWLLLPSPDPLPITIPMRFMIVNTKIPPMIEGIFGNLLE